MTNQTIEQAVERFGNQFDELKMKSPKNSMPGLERERLKDLMRKALQAQRDAGAREERKKIGAMIEEADYARKVGEKTGDPIAVWEVQDVIRQIKALTPLPDKE